MVKRSDRLLKKFLRERSRVLEERPLRIRDFIEKLVESIGGGSTIIVFGGRGEPGKLYSREPRDLDILVVTRLRIDYVERIVGEYKPRGLPVDVVIVDYRDFKPCDPLIKNMLEKSTVIHNGLDLKLPCIDK